MAAKHAEENAQREAEAKEKFENGEISEAEYKTMMTVATRQKENAAAIGQTPILPGSIPAEIQDPYMSEDELIDIAADLTDDDKIYLAMK